MTTNQYKAKQLRGDLIMVQHRQEQLANQSTKAFIAALVFAAMTVAAGVYIDGAFTATTIVITSILTAVATMVAIATKQELCDAEEEELNLYRRIKNLEESA